jgi:hypothetical protein
LSYLSKSKNFNKKNICLLIAHPDDECMFFTPTIEAMKKAQDLEINSYNVAISIVGKDQEFKILSSEEVESYLKENQGMEVV